MIFNKHYRLIGEHAFLGASKYSWLNYDEHKLIESFENTKAKERGIELHEFAAKCIKLKQSLPDEPRTLNMYVNDAIKFGMTPEQVLYYSDNCFGTTDSISFDGRLVRIHDYKSGTVLAKMEQLYIYAALFCLEYGFDPKKLEFETRIYQCDTVWTENPTYEIIRPIMNKIIDFDQIVDKLRMEETL